jgi:hypothetical protein
MVVDDDDGISLMAQRSAEHVTGRNAAHVRRPQSGDGALDDPSVCAER